MQQSKNIEKYIRYFDPVLSANRDSDLYAQVASLISGQKMRDQEHFSAIVKGSFAKIYGGDNWRLNPETSQDTWIEVMYNHLIAPRKLQGLTSNARNDGNQLEFISFPTTSMADGETEYYEDESGNGLRFSWRDRDAEHIEAIKRIQIGSSLGLALDQYNRVLYPEHFLDNLFLNDLPNEILKMPHHIVGRVYLLQPPPDNIEDLSYYSSPNLEAVSFDKQQRLIRFGEAVNGQYIEVARGFLLSILHNRIVSAWVRLSQVNIKKR